MVSAGVEFMPQSPNEAAGLVLYQNNQNHLRMEIVKSTEDSDKRVLRLTACVHEKNQIITEYQIESQDLVEIQLRASKQQAQVWLVENGKYQLVQDKIDLLPYTTEEAGGFVGCTIGMYATSNGIISEKMNYADFVWFHYDNQ